MVAQALAREVVTAALVVPALVTVVVPTIVVKHAARRALQLAQERAL